MAAFAYFVIHVCVILLYSHEECQGAWDKFTHPQELSAVDRDIARLKLIPFYRMVCPKLDWDAVDEAMYGNTTR